MQAELATR